MQIGIFGTGVVGQTLAAALDARGNDIMVGTRDPDATLASNAGNAFNKTPFREWHRANPRVRLETFASAARFGEVLINATAGTAAMPALEAAGTEPLGDKILIDIANPLDFSRGMPPTLTVCNTDSLGEQIQSAFPRLRVVKTLNTTNAFVMVNPAAVGNGDHTMFLCGNDADAKRRVADLLREWFGWHDLIDLGDITNARGTEMLLPIWVRLLGALGTPMFNFKIVR